MSKAHGLHKKPSKRVPCRRRYKIEKKVREHHRRMRKIAKKDGLKKKGNKKKLQSMPRSCPFSLEDWHGLTYLSPKEAAKLKRAQQREQELEQETTVVSTLAPEFDVSTAPLATESTSSQVSVAINQRLKNIRGSKATKEKNALVEQDLHSTLKGKVKKARKARKSAKSTTEAEESEEMQITPAEEGEEAYDFETEFN